MNVIENSESDGQGIVFGKISWLQASSLSPMMVRGSFPRKAGAVEVQELLSLTNQTDVTLL